MLLSFFLVACSNTPYRGGDVLGAEAFVIDSYKIKEGKFSILEMEGQPVMELDPQLLCSIPNTISNGDVLSIRLFSPDHKELSQAVSSIGDHIGFQVLDGHIRLPDLLPISVDGLTLEEAICCIQNAYDLQLDGVEVFVKFLTRHVQKVELAGLVNRSSIPVKGSLRLFEVLAEAQVPPIANLFKSYLVRDGLPIPVDMNKLVKHGDMTQNVVMKGGDKIYIAEPSAATLMVMGEVRREMVIDVPNGMLPLQTAIARAGGIPFTGNKGVIQVVRGNILCPKVYTLTWKHIMRLPTTSMLLMPGDIVYVAATPITEWNRLVQQILPTLTGVELLRKGVSGVVAVP